MRGRRVSARWLRDLMGRIVFLCAWLIALPVRAGAMQAQPPSGATLTGVVVDTTGAVLPDAQVDLKTGSGVSGHTTTDTLGAFRFDRVPRGSYDVLVTFEGFQPTTMHVRGRHPSPTAAACHDAARRLDAGSHRQRRGTAGQHGRDRQPRRADRRRQGATPSPSARRSSIGATQTRMWAG
jgi:hypothetical protein